jgi:pimeloyl-ACP methyl ester carboxylesterase
MTSKRAGSTARRTFVLIHGAWHGGWCWREVADILQAKGHKVFTPTLTGLADRSHLLSRTVDLDTHIADVVNLFRWEEIEDAVLVGHSYGGWPISGAVEKIGGQVASIVYLDAFVPNNGDSGVRLAAPAFRKSLEDALAAGDVGRAPPPAEAFKILDPAKAAWVQSRMTPQPTGVSVQPIALTGVSQSSLRCLSRASRGRPDVAHLRAGRPRRRP